MKRDNTPENILYATGGPSSRSCPKEMLFIGVNNGPTRTDELAALSPKVKTETHEREEPQRPGKPISERPESVATNPPKTRKPREAKSYIGAKMVLSKGQLDALKKLLRITSKLVKDEIPIELDADKLSIRVMDSSRELIADYVFPSSIFEEFRIEHVNGKVPSAQLPVRFRAKIGDFLTAIKDASQDDKVTIDFKLMFARIRKTKEIEFYKPVACPNCSALVNDENNKRQRGKRGKYNNLYTCTNCGWKGKAKRKCKKVKCYEDSLKLESSGIFITTVQSDAKDECPVKLYRDIPEVMPLPKTYSSTRQKIVSKELYKKVGKIREHNQYFAIIGSVEGIILEGLSTDRRGYGQNNCAKTEIKKSSSILLDSEGHEPQRAVFSVNHFENAIPKDKGLADRATLEWSSNQPMRITWHMNTIAEATVQFFLAPRKESNTRAIDQTTPEEFTHLFEPLDDHNVPKTPAEN